MKKGSNRLSCNNKGQMKISFGMIFSLLIIIVIVAFAFFGIKKFIEVQNATTVGQFRENLQNDIDDLYLGPQGNPMREYSLPNKIEGVCFEEEAYENLYFIPPGEFDGMNIEHVNWERISEENNNNKKLCIENVDGTVTIKLEKDFGENLVTILR